jgi:hypothetical protein
VAPFSPPALAPFLLLIANQGQLRRQPLADDARQCTFSASLRLREILDFGVRKRPVV